MLKNTFKNYPDEKGYFGQFGGRYVSETLMPLILDVEKEYEKVKNDKNFNDEFHYYLKTYVGRPSPLFFAKRITEDPEAQNDAVIRRQGDYDPSYDDYASGGIARMLGE